VICSSLRLLPPGRLTRIRPSEISPAASCYSLSFLIKLILSILKIKVQTVFFFDKLEPNIDVKFGSVAIIHT
jgi:hypothetical protein